MGAGYGMVSPGIFRLAPGLRQSGGDEDPLAALIGNALGSFQQVREKRASDALAAKREQDQTNWRDLQTGIQEYQAGLSTTPPSNDPSQPASAPAVTAGGQSLYRMGPSAHEQQQIDLESRQRVGRIHAGHLMARQMGIETDQNPLSDDDADAVSAQAPSFTSLWEHTQGKPPAYHIEKDAHGVGHWVPDSPPSGTPIGPGGTAVVPGIDFGTPGDKPVKSQEDAAAFGAQALAAWKDIERERTANPTVEVEAGQILSSPKFVQAIPLIKSSADMVQALRTAGASPQVQSYMRARWEFLNVISRTRFPGSRGMSGQMLPMMSEFMPGLDTGGNAEMRRNELRSIATAQTESGYDINPALWNNAVRRMGVGNIDLQNLLSGGSGYNAKHTDYPPGFVPK